MVAATMRDDGRPGARTRPSGSPDAGRRAAHRDAAGAAATSPTTAQLAEAITGRRCASADDGAAVAATTGGFPLHVVEAVRATADGAGRRHRTAPSASCCAGRPRLRLTARRPGRSPALAAAVGRNFTLDLLVRGGRPRRRQRGAGGRRALAAPDPARASATATTSPTTCCATSAYDAGQPAEAVAAAPARRPGPRAPARRRPGCGVGPARRAVRPRRAAGAGGGATTGAPPTSPPGCSPTVEAIRLHEEALSIVARTARGAGPDQPGARPPGGDGGAAQRQVRLLVSAAAGDAGTAIALAEVLGQAGVGAERSRRALVHAVRAR